MAASRTMTGTIMFVNPFSRVMISSASRSTAWCRSAPAPFRKYDRDPASRTPAFKSRMPSASPNSMWLLGLNSNLRGSPHFQATTLSVASFPAGTSGSGGCGICQSNPSRCSAATFARSSASFIRPFNSPSAPAAAFFCSGSFSRAISFPRSFCSARNRSNSDWLDRHCSSSRRTPSTSTLTPFSSAPRR